MSQRIALFGGSFDPIHHGHLIVARSVAERVSLDKIIFLPSALPPHKQGEALADPAHRAAMVALAIQSEAQPANGVCQSASRLCRFEMSDFDLMRSGPSYTIDTIEHFRRTLGREVELHWIIGADSLNELTGWHRVAELVDACRILTASRPGSDAIDWTSLRSALSESQIEKLRRGVTETPRIDISSTDVRRRVQRNQSILRLVPDSVAHYIQKHSLYHTHT